MGGNLAFFLTALAHRQPLTWGAQTVLLHPSGLGEREEHTTRMGFQISTGGPQRNGGGKQNSFGKTGPKHTLS